MKIKNYLIILAATLVSFLCIMLALPHDAEKFNYDYNIGQPWRYDQVIAQYAFPIKKSEKQFRHEQDSVLKGISPYFKCDETVAQQQVQRFLSDAASHAFGDVPQGYVRHVRMLLEEIYESGVMDPKEYNRAVTSSTKAIRLVDGAVATTQDIAGLYSTRTAYEYIMEQDAENYPRSVMVHLNVADYLTPNIIFDEGRTLLARNEAKSGVSPMSGMIQAGERIIDRGELITQQKHDILESLKAESLLKKEKQQRSRLPLIAGQGGIILLLFFLLMLYIILFRRYILESVNAILLIYTIITVFCVVSSLFVKFQFYNVYMIPFAMAAIFTRVFMDSRTAFMTQLTMIIIASIPLHTNYQFVVTEMMAGIVAVYSVRELTQRSQLFKAAFYVTAITMAVGFCFDLIHGVKFASDDHSWYYYIVFNGVALLFAYPLLYIIERLFGFTSSVTLIELSNINSPIFRRMSKEAQGTFVHSMQVGNLAAEVASTIGARVQLVRTGAMYHDIGKMNNPAFFTENQSSVNPHDSLEEERSASIIINHVTDGLKVADKYGLPKVIRDFILTHHGTSMVKYFYIQSCNKLGEENVDKALYTYPGRNPFTREQAILMMADSIEAASRSLKEYTEEGITKLVNGIIDAQVAARYFDECPITFRDISDAKRVFIDNLKTIYHTRIAYPEMTKKGEQPAETKPADVPAAKAAAEPQRPRLFSSNAWTWKKN